MTKKEIDKLESEIERYRELIKDMEEMILDKLKLIEQLKGKNKFNEILEGLE